MLAPELHEARVLDLFAGTGALGLEALSRGGASATFVENDRRGVAVLRRNLEVLPGARTEVLPMTAARALQLLDEGGRRYELAFLDPPYEAGLLAPALHDLARRRLMTEAAVIVCEHHGRAEPPPAPAGWRLTETRRFGDVSLTFYRPDSGEERGS